MHQNKPLSTSIRGNVGILISQEDYTQNVREYMEEVSIVCTINSKINANPKDVYLPISKLHSLRLKSSVLSKWASKHL